MKLENSDGNYVVITNSDSQRVDAQIYESEAVYVAGLDPFFDKYTTYTFHCGEELDTALSTTTGSTGQSVQDNINDVCMTVIENLATVDPNRFRPSYNDGGTQIYIKGDWFTT